jgi:hypothetical protein
MIVLKNLKTKNKLMFVFICMLILIPMNVKAKIITDVKVTLTEPIDGQLPNYDAVSFDPSLYIINGGYWTKCESIDGLCDFFYDENERFIAGQIYEVVIDLYATKGNTIHDPEPTKITVNGLSVEVSGLNDDPSSICIMQKFVAVEAGTYSISMINDENGTTSADVLYAKDGEIVELLASPKDGYRFVKWVVVKGNVTIDDNKFVMPNESVIIEAEFEREIETVSITKDSNEKLENNFPWWSLIGIPIIGIVIFCVTRVQSKKQK